MKILINLLCALFLIINVSCTKEIEKEGYVNVEGGKIWYKIVGDGEGIPLLILHGGPGGRSCGMIPGFSLLSNERPLIFYDQLGSGNSDRPGDSTLWELDRFVEEIDPLRKALNLDELHILGHSCGSTILIEYLITKKPKGIKSVIFSSPYISGPDWIKDSKILLTQLPTDVQDTIAKYEATKNYTSLQYLAAADSFNIRYLMRNTNSPLVDLECKNVQGFNSAIYNYMWGPNEFTVNGTLMDFDRTPDLDKINEPILFIAGEFDEARSETMYKFQKLSNNANVEIIDDAAHMTMIDQPDKVAEAIGRFLKKVENDH